MDTRNESDTGLTIWPKNVQFPCEGHIMCPSLKMHHTGSSVILGMEQNKYLNIYFVHSQAITGKYTNYFQWNHPSIRLIVHNFTVLICLNINLYGR